MSARAPRVAIAALALSLVAAACGGEEAAGGAAATGDPAAASAPSDTGLSPSVTVDTQATPGDTAEPAR